MTAFSLMIPVGFAAGALFGQAEWRHPRQMLNLAGRMTLAGILVVLSLAIAFTYTERTPEVGARFSIVALALPAVGVVLLLDIVVIWIASARLRRFEWLN